jgi:hypothetical protein
VATVTERQASKLSAEFLTSYPHVPIMVQLPAAKLVAHAACRNRMRSFWGILLLDMYHASGKQSFPTGPQYSAQVECTGIVVELYWYTVPSYANLVNVCEECYSQSFVISILIMIKNLRSYNQAKNILLLNPFRFASCASFSRF